ncbi:hypothetical protein A7979_08595 [Rothia nasimurium]|uniref:Uncharacterized protein n=1 Tax=Rothia nasimurium TaxID=85336 RepID=A0A1Y1RTP9_9MICC|nr:hypothetical protein [Rothia nasimurium]ORC25066.1 hypothetical protein A7979_08595 [Rothia nasimurium]
MAQHAETPPPSSLLDKIAQISARLEQVRPLKDAQPGESAPAHSDRADGPGTGEGPIGPWSKTPGSGH